MKFGMKLGPWIRGLCPCCLSPLSLHVYLISIIRIVIRRKLNRYLGMPNMLEFLLTFLLTTYICGGEGKAILLCLYEYMPKRENRERERDTDQVKNPHAMYTCIYLIFLLLDFLDLAFLSEEEKKLGKG